MSHGEIDKAFVSLYDTFLFEFDEKHPKSASQIKEIQKHERIARMRDDKQYQDDSGEIWKGF